MIICAALKIQYNNGKIDFIGGVRHPWCYENYDNAYWIEYASDATVIEGFLTHENKFLNRQEAYQHAVECKQISPALKQYKQSIHEDELYSEDLY